MERLAPKREGDGMLTYEFDMERPAKERKEVKRILRKVLSPKAKIRIESLGHKYPLRLTISVPEYHPLEKEAFMLEMSTRFDVRLVLPYDARLQY